MAGWWHGICSSAGLALNRAGMGGWLLAMAAGAMAGGKGTCSVRTKFSIQKEDGVMKKPMGIIHKFRVFVHWITAYKYGAIECCHYCGGINIQILEGADDGNIYKAKYKCLKCGATASVTEFWLP